MPKLFDRPHTTVPFAQVQLKEAPSQSRRAGDFASGLAALSPSQRSGYQDQRDALSAPLQLKAGEANTADIHSAAADGISGMGGVLPHLSKI